MSCVRLAFNSEGLRRLSTMAEGDRGIVVHAGGHKRGLSDRLTALGVTPGAPVVVLQTCPGVVFLCDQTELAVERAIADTVIVQPLEGSR